MKRSSWISVIAASVMLTSCSGAALAQVATPYDSIVTTRHSMRLHGKAIRYTARAGSLPLYVNDTGELMARMFFIAYIADPVPGEPRRPLTFLWNGGPGSSSSQVHVVGFGPKRIKTGDTYPAWQASRETELLDNQETWLVTSDLVFVDPIGTGYSRATSIPFRDILYTERGDIEAVAEFIRLYRTRFDAWDAPLFIAGESYGTTRAMGVAEALEKRRTRVSGVVLISGGFDVGQRVPQPLNAALQVPKYAVAAHYHRRLAPDLQSLSRDEIANRSAEWARRVYAPALVRRDSLSTDERAAVISDLEKFTGIPAADIDQRTLSISAADFADRLLRDRGLELGRYDLRMTTKSRGSDRQWLPFLDPSLLPMIDLMQGTSPLFVRYLRDSLKYRSDLLYRGPFGEAFHPLPLTIAQQGYASDWMALMWNRGSLVPQSPSASQAPTPATGTPPAQPATPPASQSPPLPPLRRAMDLDPRLRVMNMKGMYDGSCAAMEEALSRAEPGLKARVTNRCYAGGHMMYSDLDVRRALQRDFTEFVRTALAAARSDS